MNMQRFFSMTLAVYLSLGAVLPSYAANWISKTTIRRVAIHDSGTAIFVFVAVTPVNSDSCGLNDFIVLQKSNLFFREIYSALLLAQSTGETVGGYLYGCDASFNRPILTRLDLLVDPNVTYP